MAAALLTKHAREHEVEIVAMSAGLLTEDRPPPRRVKSELLRRSIDVSEHRSRLLTPELIDDADLILGATRTHAWNIVEMRPTAVGRVFTMREAVRLGHAAGGRRPTEPVEEWTAQLHQYRQFAGPSPVTDDIMDPLGHGRRVHARVASDIDDITEQLVDLLQPHGVDTLPPLRWVAPPAFGT